MNKLWYSLAFILLSSSFAIAQDITHKVESEVLEDQKIESESPISQPQKSNDAQTIFFTDDSVIDEIEAEQAESMNQTNNSDISAPQKASEDEDLALLPKDIIEEDEMIAAEIAAQAKDEAEERSSLMNNPDANTPHPLIPEVADKPIVPIENKKAEETADKLPPFVPEMLPRPLEKASQQINDAPEIPEKVMPKAPKEAASIEKEIVEPSPQKETEEIVAVESSVTEESVTIEPPVEAKIMTPAIEPSLLPLEPKQENQISEEKSAPTSAEPLPVQTLKKELEKEIAPKIDPSIKPVEKTIPETKDNKPFTLPSTPNNSRPRGPFALDETAPINSNIMGDTGFAPSLLNKKIGISPEQRAKMLMKQKYDEMDSNKDGVISEEEFVKYKTEEARKIAYEIFKRVDKNDDRNLSVYEYEILMNKMIESYIKAPKPN